MHIVSEPPILYLGTPVVLISTVNQDGSYNLAPMSSAFWLGWRCVLALSAVSKTTENMIRVRQCVMNLPSESMVAAVNRLALTTGTDPVPPSKVARGYRYEKRKFEISGLTPIMSQTVAAPRVEECPVQLETVVEHVKDLAENDEKLRGRVKVFEMRVQRVHVAQEILMEGRADRIDPDKWRPLIMSFQRFYGLSPNQIHESTLGQVPEALYRSPDIDRARQVEELAD
jgi:flavin reductase (DIM6/NTAB) family NADH-FMN oxidoreductase RutF